MAFAAGGITLDWDGATNTTTDATTATQLASQVITIPSGKSQRFRSYVLAIGPSGDTAHAECTFVAKNVSGSVSVVTASIIFLAGGTTALLGDTSLLTAKLSHVVSSSKIQQSVNGVAATTIIWTGILERMSPT